MKNVHLTHIMASLKNVYNYSFMGGRWVMFPSSQKFSSTMLCEYLSVKKTVSLFNYVTQTLGQAISNN